MKLSIPKVGIRDITKSLKMPMTVSIVLVFTTTGIHNIVTRQNAIELKEIQLKSSTSELKTLQLKYDSLNYELEKSDKTNKEQVDKLNKELEDNKKKQLELEKQLQAKIDYKNRLNEIAQALSGSSKAQAAALISGSKLDWLKASGIPESEWWAVDYIVSKESGWNPCSYNPGKSNCSLTADQVNATQGRGVACGLGQSLPCGKWGANWTDPVNQLQHMNTYVQKYGGWSGAVSYWQAHHNY